MSYNLRTRLEKITEEYLSRSPGCDTFAPALYFPRRLRVHNLLTWKEASLNDKLALRSSDTVQGIILSTHPAVTNRHDFAAGSALPEAVLVSYVSCPVTSCSAIVIPTIEKVAQARRYDLLSRTWSLRCPRCSMQFSAAESEFRKATIRVERIRRDYPDYRV